ncbi:Surface polysaccharide O-acyltransferase, integral membrane enzyme [Lachnospiraceae bacterium NK3A20]|nr:Surface polysaccharide O-acyltransferase, integral membrane enzyme [Lachnospiraceae bacterium NK3A20]
MTHPRESKFELMRIFAMLLIVAQHAIERGSGIDEWSVLKERGTPLRFVSASLLGSWGQIGVILFVIITAWFSAEQKGIRSSKAIVIALQSWLTSLAVTAAVFIIKPSVISGSIILKEGITPVFQQYWFVTTFLAFYLMLPLLQKLVSGISEHSLGFICLILTPLIPLYNYLWQNVGGALADFIYIFLLTVYLKRKENNWFERNRRLAILGILLLEGLIITLRLTFTYLLPGHENGFIALYQNLRGRTVLTIGVPFLIFYCFKHSRIQYHKWINIVGKATFGIYLLHENMLLRVINGEPSLLWSGIFHIDWWYANSNFAGLVHIAAAVTILIVCIPGALLIEKVAEKLLIKPVKSVCEKFDREYMRIFGE